MQDFSSFWGKKALIVCSVTHWPLLLSKPLNLLEPQFFYNFEDPSPSPPRGLQPVLNAETFTGQGSPHPTWCFSLHENAS